MSRRGGFGFGMTARELQPPRSAIPLPPQSRRWESGALLDVAMSHHTTLECLYRAVANREPCAPGGTGELPVLRGPGQEGEQAGELAAGSPEDEAPEPPPPDIPELGLASLDPYLKSFAKTASRLGPEKGLEERYGTEAGPWRYHLGDRPVDEWVAGELGLSTNKAETHAVEAPAVEEEEEEEEELPRRVPWVRNFRTGPGDGTAAVPTPPVARPRTQGRSQGPRGGAGPPDRDASQDVLEAWESHCSGRIQAQLGEGGLMCGMVGCQQCGEAGSVYFAMRRARAEAVSTAARGHNRVEGLDWKDVMARKSTRELEMKEASFEEEMNLVQKRAKRKGSIVQFRGIGEADSESEEDEEVTEESEEEEEDERHRAWIAETWSGAIDDEGNLHLGKVGDLLAEFEGDLASGAFSDPFSGDSLAEEPGTEGQGFPRMACSRRSSMLSAGTDFSGSRSHSRRGESSTDLYSRRASMLSIANSQSSKASQSRHMSRSSLMVGDGGKRVRKLRKSTKGKREARQSMIDVGAKKKKQLEDVHGACHSKELIHSYVSMSRDARESMQQDMLTSLAERAEQKEEWKKPELWSREDLAKRELLKVDFEAELFPTSPEKAVLKQFRQLEEQHPDRKAEVKQLRGSAEERLGNFMQEKEHPDFDQWVLARVEVTMIERRGFVKARLHRLRQHWVDWTSDIGVEYWERLHRICQKKIWRTIVSRCVQIALKRWRRFVPLCKKEYAIQGWMEHSLDTKLTSTLYQWYKWMFEEINEKAKTARVVAHWERIEMRRSLRDTRDFKNVRVANTKLVMDEIATKRLANKDVELVTKLFPGTSNSCAKLVARFVKFFVEADTDGGGSLDKEEVAQMVWKLHGKKTSLTEVRKKVLPLLGKWDLDGNGTLEFPEFVSMLLCDDNFSMKVDPKLEIEVMHLMNAHQPQVIDGELTYAGAAEAEAEEARLAAEKKKAVSDMKEARAKMRKQKARR